MELDMERVAAFAEQVAESVMGAATTAMIVVGDQLGLYPALAESGPLTAAELAYATGSHERYVREWLAHQAAAGFLDYDAETGRFTLPPEHGAVLAAEESPVAMCGAALLPAGMFRGIEKVVYAFRTGRGIPWDEHDPAIFASTERFFAVNYRSNLVSEWIPALDGVDERLRSGARVADVGCGHGAALILLARAYPRSRFVGYDSHDGSAEVARKRAADAGVAERVRFEVADAAGYAAAGDLDLVCFFSTLHDLGDPVAAAAHARTALAPDGTLLLVEPLAGDDLPSNLAANPGAVLHYAASTFLCIPHSLSEPVALGLGGQAGEPRLRAVLDEAGYRHVRRVAENQFTMVLEARR